MTVVTCIFPAKPFSPLFVLLRKEDSISLLENKVKISHLRAAHARTGYSDSLHILYLSMEMNFPILIMLNNSNVYNNQIMLNLKVELNLLFNILGLEAICPHVPVIYRFLQKIFVIQHILILI